MTTKLRAKKPEPQTKRLKMYVYGAAGVGKTTGCIHFPNAYIIDTEKGTDFYSKTINDAGSVVLQTYDPDIIYDELRLLLTEQHEYRTLIIDPITQVYNAVQEKWQRVFEKYAKTDKEKEVQDFGLRFWSKVKGNFKAILRLLLQIDMNVIVTAHQKDVYGGNSNKIGVTFDSMKGDDYLFDLIFRVERRNDELIAIKVKERAEVGQQKFPDLFTWSYDNFCKFYGKEVIERQSNQIEIATQEQVEKIKELINVVKIEDKIIETWMMKAEVSDWPEMNKDTIQKCIDYLINKLPK